MLHDGSIAEMKTGEGKTLVSTLAAYLNALTGEGVHGMFSVLDLIAEFYLFASVVVQWVECPIVCTFPYRVHLSKFNSIICSLFKQW